MTSTPEFFNVQPVQDALHTLFAQWQPTLRREHIDPRRALGRVLAAEARSPIDLPQFIRSTMDGYAVRGSDTFGASQLLPAYLICVGSVAMGVEPTIEVKRGQAAEIYTGGLLPPGADAVVMIERTQALDRGEIEVFAPVAPGENTVQIGEDVWRGDVIVPAGQRLRPQDIGGLLGVGILAVEVITGPCVGILSCGDELIGPEATPIPGQIRDINAYTLAALVEQIGGKAILLGIARDTLEDYRNFAQAGFEQVDIMVMTAGSSVSTRDLTREVINGLGKPGVLQHGLAVKPGKPTIVALCDGKPVIGLPGNPVSALLVARQIVGPIVRRALGELTRSQATVQAILASNIASTTGREDSVPVRLYERDGVLFAGPVFGKSNLIFTLIHADGLVRVPLNSNGIQGGTAVEVILFDA
jgi:molybdopterin molybdotransferase